MKLLVGLGNPGEKYARTRHNAGFMAIERIAERHGFPAWRKRFAGLVTEGELGGEKCLLLKPQTYMNESGRSVGEAVRFLKLELADVIVIHDEIDLAPGKLRVKAGGGNAGNNGLRSITAHIGNDYVRVRIGIGHPGAKEAVQYYVLHDFAKVEQVWLEPMLDAIADAAGLLIQGNSARFLNEIAPKTQISEEPKERKGKPKDEAREPGRSPPPRGAPTSGPPAEAAIPGGPLAAKLRAWLTGKKD